MFDYDILLRIEVVEGLKSIRGAAKQRILSFIETLRSDPFQEGDYVEIDETGRQIQVKIIGQHAVTYWADSPAKEVKVIGFWRAD